MKEVLKRILEQMEELNLNELAHESRFGTKPEKLMCFEMIIQNYFKDINNKRGGYNSIKLAEYLLQDFEELARENPKLFEKNKLSNKIMEIFEFISLKFLDSAIGATGSCIHELFSAIDSTETWLPDIQKKQQVEYACHEYQTSLEDEILKDCKSVNIAIPNLLFKKSRVDYGAAEKTELKKFITNLQSRSDDKDLNRPYGKSLKLALNRYTAVEEMKSCFEDRSKKPKEQLQNFRNKFESKKEVLKKQTDKPSIKFLKVVGSILAAITVIGAFFIPKIWKNKEDSLNVSLEKHLPSESSPKMKA